MMWKIKSHLRPYALALVMAALVFVLSGCVAHSGAKFAQPHRTAHAGGNAGRHERRADLGRADLANEGLSFAWPDGVWREESEKTRRRRRRLGRRLSRPETSSTKRDKT